MEGTRKEHWWRDAVIYQIIRAAFRTAMEMELEICEGSFRDWII